MKDVLSEKEKYNLLVMSLLHECSVSDVKYIIKLRALKEVYNELKTAMEADFIKNGKYSKEL